MDDLRFKNVIRATVHVKSIRVQWLLNQCAAIKAVADKLAKLLHSSRSYAFVFDHAQDMELPILMLSSWAVCITILQWEFKQVGW